MSFLHAIRKSSSTGRAIVVAAAVLTLIAVLGSAMLTLRGWPPHLVARLHVIGDAGGSWGAPWDPVAKAPSAYQNEALLTLIRTVIQIGTGSVYNPIDSTVTTISSPLTNTPTLAASTLYYVYLATGGASLIVNSTAPTSNYQGTAWKDASNRRYLGCFITDASRNIVKFYRQGNRQFYLANITVAPFLVISAGSATTSASVSCSSTVPPTSATALIYHTNLSTATLYLGSADGVTPTSAGVASGRIGPGTNGGAQMTSTPDTHLSSQAYLYCYSGAGGGYYAFLFGFVEDR